MASVTVLKFSADRGAEEAVVAVRELQQQYGIVLQDAALVTWSPEKKSPALKQRLNLATNGGVGGVFWSLLFGLIFFTPLFSIAVGVAVGTLGLFGEFGIDDNFIRAARTALTEGTSALFLITDEGSARMLLASAPGLTCDIIATRFRPAQERRLREAFIQH